MGTFYKEIAEKKNQKGIKVSLLIGALIILIYNIALLGNYEYVLFEVIIISYAMIIAAVITMVYMWLKCNMKYRYTIIDKELIIEKVGRNRRKSLLNFNIKHIISIEKYNEATNNKKLAKQYSFLCSSKKRESYKCIFEENGKLYGFYFEPSNELVSKILNLSNSIKVA